MRAPVRRPSWVLLALGALCAVSAGPWRAPSPPPERLPAEVAGCARVVRRETCEVPEDRVLRVFVPGHEARFQVGRHAVSARSARATALGTTYSVPIPEGASPLIVRAGARVLVVPLEFDASRAWFGAARALRRKGDLAGAHAALAPHLDASDPVDRALALGLSARLALARGDVREAIDGLRRSLALHRSLERTSDAAEDSFALAFALNQRSRRYDEARSVLDAVEPELFGYAEGHAALPFYRAELALETGDWRGVLHGLRTTLDGAERLGLVKLGRDARSLLAIVLHLQGRLAEGMRQLRALDAEMERAGDATPCERAEVMLNIALSLDDARMNGVVADEGQTPQSLPTMLAACPDPHLRGLGNYILASDALAAGRPAEATALLAKARASMPEPRTNDVLLFGDLEARIALTEGRDERALALHAQQLAIAQASDNLRRVWMAHVGAASVHEKRGDRKAAIDAYLQAEAVLDRNTAALPIHEGRGALLARTDRSAQAAIGHLLALSRVEDAFLVARRARARLLAMTAASLGLQGLDPATRTRFERSLSELRKARAELDEVSGRDWELSGDALAKVRAERAQRLAALRAGFDQALALLPRARPAREFGPPPPSELWLLVFREPTGWVGFAATAERVRSFALGPPETWASAIPTELRPELAAGKRLLVLPYGPIRALDVHAWFVDAGPVAWKLDVLSDAARTDGETLVIGDPTNDLPAAREEALDVARVLGGAALLGDAVTPHAVLEGLSHAGRLHWAGHGVFGGLDGLESRLPLAGGQPIGPVEILALPRVPTHVVLSACESGRSAADDPNESLGLAQSFVVAGARDVVAPTRKVDDRAAARLSSLLYRNLQQGNPPPEALWRAQRSLRNSDPDLDGFAFRTLVP